MLFDLDNVTYTRGGREVLRSVTAGVPEGITAVTGPSGSGKSSLLRLLVRLADPISGTVRFKGEDVRRLDVLALRRRAVWVPQLPALEPGTIESNMRLAADLGGGGEIDAQRLCAMAGIDQSLLSRDVERLSVGERQRAMFARALACEPEALLLDEPTAALDAQAARTVEQTISSLWSGSGISVVLVTHDPSQADRLATSRISIDRGEIA